MMGHDFSRQITEKCGTKYGNENYILGHPKWKWELYFGGLVSAAFYFFHLRVSKNYTYYIDPLDHFNTSVCSLCSQHLRRALLK